MNVRRVAVIFDDSIRPETTGVYCRHALDELVRAGRLDEVVHLCPAELSAVGTRDCDLLFVVDDGMVADLPDLQRPVAWWAIDTHLGFERCLGVARQADWTFCAQRDGAAQMRAAGVPTATWLPLACDPDLHGRVETPSPEWDVAFVGHVFPGERQRLLNLLQDRFPQIFVGQRYFEEMAATYSAAKCVFNRSIANDINMRVFEGLCSGSLLITNALEENGLSELFQNGRHLVTYADDVELLDRLAFYIEHDEERRAIATAGQAEVLARHTYRDRVETILAIVAQASPVAIEPACSSEACRNRNGNGCCRGKRCQNRTQKNGSCHSAARHSQQNGSAVAEIRNGHRGSGQIRHEVAVKEPTYFEFERPDVLELVPKSARRILDVGCGAGRLGASLKARQPCEVIGIELNRNAAAEARTCLDQVVVANTETDDLPFSVGEFDCVICADVLEHLREPAELLHKVRDWLSPAGCLVTSIPNVRNHTVVQSLLAGNWTYESAGLLDADHVRFFTRREIEKLLFRCGFDIEDLRFVPGEGYAEWADSGRRLEVSVGGLQIHAGSEQDAQEFFAYQWLTRAVAARGICIETADVIESQPRNPVAGLTHLAERHPWPAERPEVSIPERAAGWFGDGARAVLTSAVGRRSRLIVELGSWLGLSTRFLAQRAPRATIIAIDHWEGSPEHHRDPALRELLPTLYDGFIAGCWDFRDQIQPLRMATLDGLQAVADAGLTPDVIFVDADHSYGAVRADLQACRRLFPAAVLTGDDFSDPDVQRAVQEIADAEGLSLQTYGRNWLGWKLTVPQHRPGSHVPAAFGLTSIVIPAHNQLPYTKACLDSIRLRTDEPYELIVVDNGSTDGTVGYLQSLPDVRLICNDTNRGFPVAVNQGIQAARGDQVLLLNNDTIVTTGWLRRMLDVLQSAPTVGLVGPVSNCVGSEQQIPVAYSNLTELDGWAWDYQRSINANGSSMADLACDSDRLIGFCLLISRAVIEKVGLLDERFGMGCFEDDDLCRRAIESGFDVLIARASFVHHFGSTTFRACGFNLGDILRRNQRVFEQKWGGQLGPERANLNGPMWANARAASDARNPTCTCSLPNLDQHAGSNGATNSDAVRLSVCLIVRDNENTIRPCLESIRPWVDEMVVVDTGSTDRTAAICEELGARVFHWAWRDDFAAARNVSLEHARGDWILWMDSDDTIPAECGRKLHELVDQLHPNNVLGYVLQVHCPGDEPTDVTVVDHVKLIRNRPGLRFEFRIHEQILPSIRRAGGDVEFTDLYVVHSGSDRTREGQARKLERDFRLLGLELQDRPEHPFVLFNLGMTCADCGRLTEAIDYLERCITVSRPEESHLRKAFALLVSALSRDGQTDAAINGCEHGLQLYPDDKELLFRRAMLHHEVGELERAVAVYERVLDEQRERCFSSVDCGLAGFKARHNLALVFEDMGELDRATAEWEAILNDHSEYRPARNALARLRTVNRRLYQTH